MAWAPAYGLDRATLREHEVQTRTAQAMLDRMLALDSTDLAKAREPARRMVGNCRHFATFTTAVLRAHGVPARARCGFGAYFLPGHLEDHWVVEFIDPVSGEWRLCDSQIDDLQRAKLQPAFDTTAVPRDQFRVAGDVWLACRSGDVDPENCGIFDMHGLWFVQANVVRDLAALNKHELLPWDDWGLAEQDIGGSDAGPTLARLDQVAGLTASPDTELDALRALYVADDLRVPQVLRSFKDGGAVNEAWDDSGLEAWRD
ncbi:MAG: transglutaminase domain-containing protein [Deltaproteobacteria bacterium]|nr:transglutaminase domain-containing protein [Deltaproteobacteria bacterium]